jgi:HPt (histidine-containing phosphotransfer) domain-containing protein
MTSGKPPLDVAAGVARMMGDASMYRRVLARFRDEYAAFPSALRGALARHDGAGAQRLAHTLKGAAGMIEAGALQAAALGLEQQLQAASGDCAQQLGLVEAELGRVTGAIDAQLGQPRQARGANLSA